MRFYHSTSQIRIYQQVLVAVLCVSLVGTSTAFANGGSCAYHLGEQQEATVKSSFTDTPQCKQLRDTFAAVWERSLPSCQQVATLLGEDPNCTDTQNQKNIEEITAKLTALPQPALIASLNEAYLGYDDLMQDLSNAENIKCLPGLWDKENSPRGRLLKMRNEIAKQLKALGASIPQTVKKSAKAQQVAKDAERKPSSAKGKDGKPRRGKGPLGDWNPAVRIVLSMALGALAWRFRGGWMPTGSTQLARIGGVLPFVGIGYLNGGLDGAIAGAALLPMLYMPWSKWQDQGRTDGSRIGDFFMMSLRGLAQTSLGGGYLWYKGYGPGYLLSGLGMGGCYAASWDHLSKTSINSNGGMFKNIAGAPTEFSEMCTGAVLAGGLAATTIYGDPQDD